MAETIQEAKKMTSREASSKEESTTSDSTLDNDVTMKDEGYPFHKGRQQPSEEVSQWSHISPSGKLGGSGVVHMGGGIQNQKQCSQLSPWSPSSSSSGKSGGSGVVHMGGGIHDEGGQKHGQLSFGSLSSSQLGYRCGQVQHDVLQSPDHNTVHVIYGSTSRHFVHSKLTQELKTRTGLQLVPPQSRVATSSSTADSVLIVIVDSNDSVTDRFLSQAVETSGHQDTHTLYILTGYRRLDWFEEKLSRCPVMIYPEPEIHHPSYVLHRQSSVSAGASSGLKDVRTLFWDNVSTMIGASYMDPTDRAILNEFGLVQHDVLQSPHHNTVHVIYGNDTERFLHSELTEELKTRTGLQLVLSHSRVATSSSTVDSALVVIVDSNLSVTDRLLREAVETSGHTDTQTLFIQTGYRCPDWVVEKLPRFLMIYPGAFTERKDVRTLFWDNVSTMIGDPHMDPTHRAILNEFGLVQHAAFQSPDHNTVHVIYGHTNRHFVHSELTEELETRSGLQLVPPQSRVATSSFTADSVLIVIIDHHGSVTDRLLSQAEETSGHPDTHTLFIQMGYHYPDWFEEKLPRCTVMRYRRSEMHHPSYVLHRQSLVSAGASSGLKDERTLFWDNLSTMIGASYMDTTDRAILNEFGLVQHAVLQSPDHNTVHVIYGNGTKRFLHSELTEELKTRTGLQLVPPQSRVATSSSTADSVLIVIVDSNDSVTDRLLREAVETSEHTDSQTLFIQTGCCRPDWFVEKLPRFLMIYPGASIERKDVRTLFWDNVSTMIGDPHMDPTHRAILNEFDLVQHAAFQSPDHNTVHVIYGHTKKHIVHSELTEELRTRTGLQLVPPQSRVATSSSTSDSVLIVIVDSNDSVTDVLLRQAVETSGHQDTHTLFIQMGDHCPDWFEEKLPRCPVMVYPEPEMHHPSYVLHGQSSVSTGASSELKDVRTLFWDNLSTMIGDPHMDPTHRAILNEFGLVQHAAFQSPDHNTVHVIYSHTNKHFVHIALTEELETRTGLQLVPPQSRVATSSSTADSVLIVIVEIYDSVTDRLLRQAVKTSGHPDTHTLFIQMGDHCPDWAEEKLRRCTVMRYRRSEMRHPAYVLPRQSAVSAGASSELKDVRTLFWDNVSTMISATWQKHSVPDSSTQPGDDDKTTTSEDIATNHALYPHSSLTQCVSLLHREESAAASKDECKAEHSDVFVTPDAAKGLSDESDDSCRVKADFRCCYCSNDSSPSSQSTSDGESEDSASSSNSSLQSTEYHQASSVCTAGKSATVLGPDQGLPSPVFSRTWQAASLFTRKGGTLRKPGSDVILHVPPYAVKSDDGVEVHAAVCADVAQIRRLLKVSEDEQVVSPLAEFWAGRDFRFHRPVSVALPHWLPENPDPALVQVYHVTRSNNGHVDFTELNRRSQKSCTSGSKDATSLSDPDIGEVGYFSLEEDQISVFTDHFSGFVCTYCLKKGKTSYRPELYLTASGSISVPRGSLPAHVDMYAHVWDKRITDEACRQAFGIGSGPLKCIELLPNLKHSKLELGFRRTSKLVFRLDLQGQLLHPGETKKFDLMSSFGCTKCAIKGRQLPKSHQWAMQFPPGCQAKSSMEVAVDVTHMSGDATNPEQAATTLVVKVEAVNDQRCTTTQTDWTESDSTIAKHVVTGSVGGQLSDNSTRSRAYVPPSLYADSNGDASGATCHHVPASDTTASLVSRCEKGLCRQNGAAGLCREDTASGSTSGAVACLDNIRQVEGLQGAQFTNCRIMFNANTHNNNVNKLGKMNTGNTNNSNYNVPAEAETEALDYEPRQLLEQGDIPVVEMPDDASRQDTSRAEDTDLILKYPQDH